MTRVPPYTWTWHQLLMHQRVIFNWLSKVSSCLLGFCYATRLVKKTRDIIKTNQKIWTSSDLTTRVFPPKNRTNSGLTCVFPHVRHANCDWLICLSALTAIGQSNNDDASVFVFRRQTATKVTKDLRSLLLIATRQPNVFRAFNRVIILESFLKTRYYRKNSRKGSAP